MKLGELIKLLDLLPGDTPFLNAPTLPHTHATIKTEIAVVMGDTIFNHHPTSNVETVRNRLKGLVGQRHFGGQPLFEYEATEETEMFITSQQHRMGDAIAGVLMTTHGIMLMKDTGLLRYS